MAPYTVPFCSLRRWIRRTAVLLTGLLLVGLHPSPATAQGNLRYTVSFTQVLEDPWGMGVEQAWGTVLTDLLNQSGRFIVLGESDMRGAGVVDQTLDGYTWAQLRFESTILNVQPRPDQQRARGEASRVEVGLSLIDAASGRKIASERVRGQDNTMKQAFAEAAEKAVDWMITQLPNVVWRGTVVMVKDGQVYIDRGRREGVEAGQPFAVVVRDSATGKVLDESVSEVARLEAVTVREKTAICMVVSGNAEAVRQGHLVGIR